MKLSTLNSLSQADFVQHLAGLFEHSPWIAQHTWPARPFASREALHTALLNTVQRADTAAQLALICAHPADLAGKPHRAGRLTQESAQNRPAPGCTTVPGRAG
ncbi:MAG: 2-oxo-4-hydroxy-4-carboxy-5-ureidoimidazoline decarboxylase [Gammaproteobacteria bacterium]